MGELADIGLSALSCVHSVILFLGQETTFFVTVDGRQQKRFKRFFLDDVVLFILFRLASVSELDASWRPPGRELAAKLN